jgi:TonB family protein
MTLLLYTSLALIILWATYKLLLSEISYLRVNRIILLVLPIIPIGIYNLPNLFQSNYSTSSNIVQITLSEVNISASKTIEGTGFSYLQTLIGIYIIGFVISLLIALIGYFKVFNKLKNLTFNTNSNNVKIAFSEEEKSFSFFNYIHVNKELQDNPQVLQHEMIHVTQGHSWDVLIYNIYRIVFWFHPVIYLLDNDIKLVHEYLADEKVGSTSGKRNYANSLLNIYFGTGSIQFINQFNNQKFIKMRLKMLSKNKTKSQIWRYATVPALIGVLTIGASSFTLKETSSPIEITNSDPVYDSVDVMPEFKGGMQELFAFMGNNIKYPKQSAKDGIEGKVMVEFIVTKNGEVKDAKVLKGVNDEIDAESIRVINAMPNWTPGVKDGKKVNVKMVLPIAYKL